MSWWNFENEDDKEEGQQRKEEEKQLGLKGEREDQGNSSESKGHRE